MELRIRENGATALVAVRGKLTATTLAESLRGAVKGLFARKINRVIIDMAEVIHIDSTGVGELVSAYTSATNENGLLQLWHVPESSRELLEITNLLDIFEVLPDDDQELRNLFPH